MKIPVMVRFSNMIFNHSRSSTPFLPFILLGFLMCCFSAHATEPTPTETNSLIVAYQLLDDSWIQEVGALTNNFARIYKDSLSTNQPPSYGAVVQDGNSWEYTSFSQRELWDYMYNHSYSNGVHPFRNYIEQDEYGEYITVAKLITASSPGRIEGTMDGSLKMTINDYSIVNNGKRLATLSTVQTEQEIETISNAFCNCDWQIVTNIFNCVYAISNTLDSVEYNTYHSMTNTEAILDALYSNWQGQDISLADWTRYIWVYLTTNNSGKPLKDLLVDLNYSLTNGFLSVSNSVNQIYTDFPTNLWKVLGISYVPSNVGQFFRGLESSEQDILNWQDSGLGFSDFLYDWLDSSNNLSTRNDWLNRFTQTFLFDSYLNFLQLGYQYPILRDTYNTITNKTEGVVYGVILPELSNVQNEPNIYAALTNAYLTSYNQQSDLTWLDRVELLLAALVFPDISSTNTVENADTAKSASEQTARQFTDQLNQVSQALVSHSVEQDFTQVSGHLSTLFTTLRQNLVFRKPEVISVSTLEEPLGVLGEQPTDSFHVDTTFGGLSDFIDFLRNLTSLLWVVLFFILAYKAILVIFKAYYSVYNFSQAIFRKILG